MSALAPYVELIAALNSFRLLAQPPIDHEAAFKARLVVKRAHAGVLALGAHVGAWRQLLEWADLVVVNGHDREIDWPAALIVRAIDALDLIAPAGGAAAQFQGYDWQTRKDIAGD